MANPHELCAVAINESNADGTVTSTRYWAQVVQMVDPRIPNRPRIEVDLVQEWIQGLEPGRPTLRFVARQNRRRERQERQRLQQEQVQRRVDVAVQVEEVEGQTTNEGPGEEGEHTRSLICENDEFMGWRVSDWEFCPMCGANRVQTANEQRSRKRSRNLADEDAPASPPYSRTRWPSTEEEGRYNPRARTGNQAPSTSVDAQMRGT